MKIALTQESIDLYLREVHGFNLKQARYWSEYSFGLKEYTELCQSFISLLKLIRKRTDVYVELTDGAKAGSIWKFDIPEDFELEEHLRYMQFELTNTAGKKHKLNIIRSFLKAPAIKFLFKEFDDTIEEKWVFTRKAAPEETIPDLFDHFGVKLELDKMVIYQSGMKNSLKTAFGKITRITANGTIFVKRIPTNNELHYRRMTSDNGEERISSTVPASSLIVFDGDLMDKVMLARLSM